MTNDILKIPNDLRTALQAELHRDERLYYAARPNWRSGAGGLIGIFLFGVFWSAISFVFFGMSVAGLLGLTVVKSGKAPASTGLLLFIFLFSLPFVAIGLSLLAAPFLSIRKTRQTVHAVTDRRVVNVVAGNGASCESYPLAKLNFLKRRDRADGTGTLTIGYGVEKDSDGDPRPLTMEWTGIPDVKRAERSIRDHAAWVH